MTREAIGYENGVLGGVISTLTAFAAPGDGVLLHSPTYIGFTRSIENNGYRIVHSPLTLDERGVWRMDYEDMDRKLKEHHIHVAVFCSPHNPCGRVWERWEIEKAMEVYKANDCVVISDEIWSDLTLGNHQHIPTQSVSEDARNRTVAFYAPSKTFNLAGLVGSYHIIYNPTLRDRIVAKSSKCHYNDMNVLSMHALIGAYRPEGHEWLDELKAVLTGNVDYAYDYITKHFQGVSLAKPEGTYMLLDEASVTGTANIVMAAVLAKGSTTIYNAACEPYLQQLCKMLNRMGARISGIASNLLTIEGVDSLGGTEHTLLPDMIEVGSFIGMAAMNQSELTVKNVSFENLGIIPAQFARMASASNSRATTSIFPGRTTTRSRPSSTARS